MAINQYKRIKTRLRFIVYLHTPAYMTIELYSRYDCVMLAVFNERLLKKIKILKCQAFDVSYMKTKHIG